MISASPVSARNVPPDHRSVLIVDDSAVARSMIARMVDASDRYAVAGSVANVDAAFAFLMRARVDVILLDLEMPGVSGLTALPDLITAGRGAKILVVSASTPDGASATVQALALGAADTLVKPGAQTTSSRFAELLSERLDRLFDPPALVVPRGAGAAVEPKLSAAPPCPTSAASGRGTFDVVAIGASTGGIHALSLLLRELPASFSAPILITQHLPTTFMSHFAAQLAVLGGRPCDVATDYMRIRPGRIVVAPGDHHMKVVALTDGAAIRLIDDTVASGCLPSIDPMFDSIAEVFGARALGIVLSGMGRDGSTGAVSLHRAGGTVIAQDVASSVVWGMPGAAVATGVVSATMPPDAIGRLIAARPKP
ncbi:chemotaxis-specific protein-glutamate methyltransferase CheB [Sphingomonas bacterium]|uniref:chemotaxis-specific protein-glutamate methyltransferase CheB n=1 Tax=Sphingomonas bacterium TaxID=1895847 RepID=UPI001576EF8B|nr:chemotaxis-specific protein-glutamate methyltransferase CheB [Sphingomonas bacterium]